MINGVPSVAVTGLQRNVIAMAFCCKKGGGQKWEQLPPPKLHSNYMGTTVITVLRRDVVCGGMNRTCFHRCAADWVTRDSRILS